MKKLLAAVALTASIAASAALGTVLQLPGGSACPQLYPNGVAILPTSVEVRELCNSFYVSHYNDVQHKVVFTSARLDPATAIGSPTRINGFRPDARVVKSPTSSAYDKTGFDRGHMVAAEDASNDKEMYDTFFLTNVVPQDPTLNRGEWKKMEAKVRAAAKNAPSVSWVLTIPVYNEPVAVMANKIPVPTGMWKMRIVGSQGEYYFADNRAQAVVKQYPSIDWVKIIANQSK